MSEINPKQFPVDLTGESARNLIRNEERTFETYNERIFVPSGGVFYTDSLVIYDKDSGRRLRPLVDYRCLHLHQEASLDSGKQVCCIIVVENQTVSKVTFDYQVVGGNYSDTIANLKSIMEGVDFNSLTKISWGTQIYGKPETYPAATHKHPGTQFANWERTLVALNNIYHALNRKDVAAWQSVYDYISSQISSSISPVKLQLDNNYYTKQQLDNKVGEYQRQTQTALNTELNNYYTKPVIDGKFQKVNSRLDGLSAELTEDVRHKTQEAVTTATNQINSVAETFTNNVTALNNNISSVTSSISGLTARVTTLENNQSISASKFNILQRKDDGLSAELDAVTYDKLLPRILRMQQYKPGDIFETTRCIENETQLIKEMGYGQWERYASGDVTVAVTKEDETKTKYHERILSRLGSRFGNMFHFLKERELPSHTHEVKTTWPGRSVLSATRRNVDVVSHITIDGHANDDESDLLLVQRSSTTGGNQGHSNFQPSVTVERWRRVVSLTDPTCVGGAIITVKDKNRVVNTLDDLSFITTLPKTNTGDISITKALTDKTGNIEGNSVRICGTKSLEGREMIHRILRADPQGLQSTTNLFLVRKVKVTVSFTGAYANRDLLFFYYVDDVLRGLSDVAPIKRLENNTFECYLDVITQVHIPETPSTMSKRIGSLEDTDVTIADILEADIDFSLTPEEGSGIWGVLGEEATLLVSDTSAKIAIGAYR